MVGASNLLIIFDVEERFRSTFSDTVKGLGEWAILIPTVMMLRTEASTEVLMERLQPLIGPRDDLWIITPSGPWSGYGDPIAEDHIQAVLGRQNGNWIPKDWNEALGRRER